jgi:hypothetical protein
MAPNALNLAESRISWWTPRIRGRGRISNPSRFVGFAIERSPGEWSHKTYEWSPQRNPHQNALKSDDRKVLQKYIRKSHKRKTLRIEEFGTRLRWRLHYESLSHIRLQATVNNQKSWIAKSSNKEPLTPLSLSLQKHPCHTRFPERNQMHLICVRDLVPHIW